MKKTIIIIILGILIGSLFAMYIFSGINNKIANAKESFNAYAYQIGVFKSEKNAINMASNYSSALVINDKDYYRVYAAIAVDDKAQSINEDVLLDNNITFYKRKLLLNDNCLKIINKYEELIKRTNDREVFFRTSQDLLNVYKEYCYD